MSQTVNTKSPLIGFGPQSTARQAHVSLVPMGSNGTIPNNAFLAAHNISSVVKNGTGTYEVTLVDPGLFLQNTIPVVVGSDVQVTAKVTGISLSGSVIVVQKAGTATDSFDSLRIDFWSENSY